MPSAKFKFDGPTWIDGKQNPEYARARYLAEREEKREQYRIYTHNYRHKNRTTVRERNKEQQRKRRADNPDKMAAIVRKSDLRRKYYITIEDYEEMLVRQNNKCAICEQVHVEAPRKRLHVDHCHTTNRVRALLCHNCNNLLGKAKDSTEILHRAIAYLERYAY